MLCHSCLCSGLHISDLPALIPEDGSMILPTAEEEAECEQFIIMFSQSILKHAFVFSYTVQLVGQIII